MVRRSSARALTKNSFGGREAEFRLLEKPSVFSVLQWLQFLMPYVQPSISSTHRVRNAFAW